MPRHNNRVFKKRKAGGVHLKKVDVHDDPGMNLSASAQKLKPDMDYCDYLSENGYINDILNLNLISEALSISVLCKMCKNAGMQIRLGRKLQGLANELSIFCVSCGFNQPFLNTNYSLTKCNGKDVKIYEVNTRLTYAMRCIGRGHAAAKVFCGVMNLPAPSQRFNETVSGLDSAIETVACDSMKKAAEEARDIHDDTDISIAFDGTWQKRGHNSLNGVVVATSVETGKVVDTEVFSRFCKCPKKVHKDDCTANYFGNSGSIEVAGALKIFQRSEELHGLRYSKFLGDGDSRACKAVNEVRPYGDMIVEKLECVGHVEKRMGTRLRALKQKLKGKKLDDNKNLGGRGRLTDSVIDQLQRYYGAAIINNVGDLDAMKRAVWATYFHKASSDSYPQHGLCPTTEDTWCGFNRGILTGEEYRHKNTLPPAVLNSIKDIYRDLAHPDLLRRCLHGKTQNCNESVNNMIWKRIPKSIFVQLNTLKTGVHEAIASYNEGNIVKCHVLKALGFSPGFYTVRAMQSSDSDRIKKANKDFLQKSKEARINRRQEKCKLEDSLKDDPNNPSYGAGMH